MKYRYTRFTGTLLDEIDLESLVSQLSDLLLSSGFGHPRETDEDDRTMQALHDAILEALLNGGLLPDDLVDELLDGATGDAAAQARQELDALIDQLIDRLGASGYITLPPDLDAERQRRASGGGEGASAGRATFQVTDKALDFLGWRALRDLLGAVGRSSAGRHDTREQATGVESGAAPKPYAFGDTLNLDATATLLQAAHRARREGPASRSRLTVTHDDLMVAQGEYQSSCATVLLLDCSHSMILYGEDRFTPAKRVALALSQLIRTQYPGDALQVVLFHDSAEEVPLAQLGRVRVGPYYTNTREGLRMARRLLDRQRKDMRQIIMITDGKPSALTQPDGRIYRNPYGLDPFIVQETLAEVAACRKSGILINTFMLARDYDLVSFVRKVSEICRGKAYFTTPYTLGEYVLMDYMTRKSSLVH